MNRTSKLLWSNFTDLRLLGLFGVVKQRLVFLVRTNRNPVVMGEVVHFDAVLWSC